MESIFLMLSGVILFAGILYWFWSHIQLTQKKVQLLENAVFELRGMMTPPGGPPPSPGPSPSSGGAPPPAYDDLPDDDWGHDDTVLADANDIRSTPLTEIGAAHGHRDVLVSREDDDLMPGGAPALHVSENGDEQEQQPHDDFRELFVSQEVATPVRTPESLESMPVKELRRLAEQRGIAGAADMRKKEILAALRKQVQPAGEVAVQKTLDLTVEAEVEAEVPVEENTGAEAEILE
jgi:hypothetical protein